MTTTAPPQTLIDQYSQAWASRDLDRIVSLHAEDGIFCLHSGQAGPVEGRGAIRDAFAVFLGQFPDLEFVEQELLAADWGWAVRWTMNGTLAVAFEAGGRAAEPGTSISIDAVDVITVSDGLIAAKHTYLDWAAGLEQMGLS
jgi:steroid delta-isomerase-like uncharacterized protein